MQGIVSNEIGGATETRDRVGLKQEYLDCLRDISAAKRTLRSVITNLLRLGVGWNQLVRWAVEAGYAEKWVRRLISETLCEAGMRRRRPGAGRETPQEALALLAFARHEYGEHALSFLRAAYRAAKKEDSLKDTSLPRLELVRE